MRAVTTPTTRTYRRHWTVGPVQFGGRVHVHRYSDGTRRWVFQPLLTVDWIPLEHVRWVKRNVVRASDEQAER